jgi:hypothetical protein
VASGFRLLAIGRQQEKWRANSRQPIANSQQPVASKEHTMKRKSVGYFDGIDPAVLTSLICEGFDTIPISNGYDNYGHHVRYLNEETKVDLLMGYLHKIYAPEDVETQIEDVFHICHTYQIPLLVVVPDRLHARALQKVDHWPEEVQLVDPSQIYETVRKILNG